MALDVLEQIQEQQTCHGDLLQAQDDGSSPPPLEQVDDFLREAVNSRNRITVLRLEQEIEKFARNPKQEDLLLKPMQSSYERLAAHRIAQHYGLQSMVVSASFPKVSRILLVKTSESRLPSVRLADIPLETASPERSGPVPSENFAIKQRANRVSNADGIAGSADVGQIRLKTMEEREEEYDKARARIFSSKDLASSVYEETGAIDSLKVQGTMAVNGEGRSSPGSSNRVAIFRDREKDMKDPDYDRSYRRYSQPMDFGVAAVIPNVQHLYTPMYNKHMLDGPWGPQIPMDRPSHLPEFQFRGPWVESGYADLPYVQYNQGPADAYVQCPRFSMHSGHYDQIKDGFQYSFQHGLQATTSLGAIGR